MLMRALIPDQLMFVDENGMYLPMLLENLIDAGDEGGSFLDYSGTKAGCNDVYWAGMDASKLLRASDLALEL